MRKKWMIFAILLLVLAMAVTAVLLSGRHEEPVAPTETQPTEDTTPTTPPPAPTEPYAPRAVGNYYITTPQGFLLKPSGEHQLYLESLTPGDASRITLQILPMGVDIWSINGRWLEDLLARDTDGFTAGSTHELFVQGCRSRYMEFAQQVSGTQARGWALAMQAEGEVYVFTFLDTTENGSWEQAFLEAARSIRLLDPGEYITLEPQGLTQYTLSCGLTLQAEPGMQEVPGGGYAAVLQGDYCLLMVLEDPKQNATAALSLEGYAKTVARIHGLEPFRENAYGNLATVYTTHSQSTGLDYFYYLTVKETDESFFLCQMVCTAGEYRNYRDQFDIWATTITAAPGA